MKYPVMINISSMFLDDSELNPPPLDDINKRSMRANRRAFNDDIHTSLLTLKLKHGYKCHEYWHRKFYNPAFKR